jgi:small-conductance mechanosensitive channel
MIDATRSALMSVREFFADAPNIISAAIIFLLVGLIALLIHNLLTRLIHRILLGQGPYLISILAGTIRPTRFGFLVLSFFIALPVVPFDDEIKAAIFTILLVAAAIVAGWIVIAASHVVADIYLQRFHIDAADNLLARKHVTQIRVLLRATDTILVIITIGAAMMSLESVRQYGVSLFASAGVAGLVIGLAARPVLGNLIAGIQLAVTQPIRIDDAVVVENEFGRIEEITSTYVVLRLWDLRRMVVPLTYFIEKPFQNWTKESTSLLGAVLIYVDYTAPIARIREKATEIVKASPLWDGGLLRVHVTNASPATIEVRVLAGARSADDTFNLRCEIREKLIDFLQEELPGALPRQRQVNLAASGETGDNSQQSPR